MLTIVARLTAPVPLAAQSTALNASQSSVGWIDFSDQFLGIVFDLFPVALVIFLLWQHAPSRHGGERTLAAVSGTATSMTTTSSRAVGTAPTDQGAPTPGQSGFRRIGLDLRRPGHDLALGVLLVAVIGIPGLGLYAAGRALGITVAVDAAPTHWLWWTVPILVFSAIRSGLQEEVIMVGYLFTRLPRVGWGPWRIILASALVRGSYHLYQGFGPFLGNAVMGVVFGWYYHRHGRTMPLVVAHTLLDVISFVGYPLALAWWPALFTT
ncbi:MAG TPA: CPBP family intramembrane glutamic endopeptidase [Microbacteriaceae bacterium]|nr:CPBP family intramembrane glutamic endopeptidase [Microbacteriaceae bacterium]